MTDDPRIGEIPIPKEDHRYSVGFCPKPTVRILFSPTISRRAEQRQQLRCRDSP